MDVCNKMSSKKWAENVGEINQVDLYGIDKFSKDEIFISVVEYYIVDGIRKNDAPRWIKDLEGAKYFRSVDFFDRNGQFSMRHEGRNFRSVVDLYSFVRNVTRIKAAIDLGNAVKMAYDSVFGVGSKELYHDGTEISSHFDWVFDNNFPGSIKTKDGEYSYSKKIDIKNMSSNVIGSIVVYGLGEKFIALPAHVEENVDEHPLPRYYLHIGRCNQVLRLINEDLIVINPDSLVVFFDNPILADLFQKKVHDSQLVSDEVVIGTSFFGGYSGIDSVNFDRLYGKDVVLVPSISRESYLHMLEYAKRIEDIGVKSVTICPEPYVLCEVCCSGADLTGKWDQYVAQRAVDFMSQEMLLLVNRLKKIALTPQQFLVWCVKHDLIVNLEETVDSSLLMNASEWLALCHASDFEQSMSFDRLISVDNFTLIYGLSNAGKGMFLLTMLHSIAYKISSFGFKVSKPRKVLLIDGESGVRRLKERFRQFSEAYPYEVLYRNNLWFLSLRDSNDFSGSFFSEENQKIIIKLIKDNGINVVAIDNLFSICRFETISEKTVDKIISFSKEMAGIGVAIIFAHHANKHGEAHGSQKLRNLMQNIIKIEGKESIKSDELSSIGDCFLEAPGALINISYEECKEYPDIQAKKFLFFLKKPLGDSNPSQWVDLIHGKDDENIREVAEQKEDTQDGADDLETNVENGAQTNFENVEGLNDDEKKVFYFIKEKIKVKKKEIVDSLDLKPYVVSDILLVLIKRNLIYKEGRSSDRYYILSSSAATQ